MWKKILSMVLCSVILCSAVITVSAQGFSEDELTVSEFIGKEIEISPFYVYTKNIKTDLSISSGQASMTAYANGIPGTTTKVQITMYLEKKGLLGLYWSEVVSWTQTHSNYYGTLSKKFSVSSGTYRLRAVYVVYSGNASETINDKSKEVKW